MTFQNVPQIGSPKGTTEPPNIQKFVDGEATRANHFGKTRDFSNIDSALPKTLDKLPHNIDVEPTKSTDRTNKSQLGSGRAITDILSNT